MAQFNMPGVGKPKTLNTVNMWETLEEIKGNIGGDNGKSINQRFQDVNASLADIAYNVKSFGAKGDGVTDDAPAIRSAISAIRSKGGGRLFFPIGTYLCSSYDPLASVSVYFALNLSNITIEGQGNGSIIKAANGTLKDAVFGNYQWSIENIILRNICFDLNGANNLLTQGNANAGLQCSAIYSKYTKNVKVHDVTVKNAPGYNVFGFSSGSSTANTDNQNIWIFNNRIENVSDAIAGNTYVFDHSSIGVVGTNVFIFGNKLSNDVLSYKATAIEANGINYDVHDNIIINYNLGQIISALNYTNNGSTYYAELRDYHCHHNKYINCLLGIKLYCNAGASFSYCKIENNIIELYDNAGIGTRYGIDGTSVVDGTLNHLEISNNTIYSKADYGTVVGLQNGIFISFAKFLKIRGNKIFNIAAQAINIKPKSTFTLEEIIISDNEITDCCANSYEGMVKAIGIYSAYGNTCKNIYIENNKIKNKNYTKATMGIELYQGTSDVYSYVYVKGNNIENITKDIVTNTITLNTSNNIYVTHETINQNFDVLSYGNFSRGSSIAITGTSPVRRYIRNSTLNVFDEGTAAPTTGDRRLGDERKNTSPSEQGSTGSKYVIDRWVCVAAGTPGTWVPMRVLTGN